MEVVYYFDEEEGVSPVKKYLEQYISTDKDSPKKKNYNLNIFADINEKIKHIAGVCDGRPVKPIAKPLKDYPFFEITHRKNKNTLIRLLFFRHNNKMILLNAFDKPDNYKTSAEKGKIKRYLNKTNEYRNKFIKNKKNYEKYE
ncbi:hypothetical protein KKG58_05815 [Patescibacteria group bacterium]|nr:hypothetical protein [Patescibacteria group bacterium]